MKKLVMVMCVMMLAACGKSVSFSSVPSKKSGGSEETAASAATPSSPIHCLVECNKLGGDTKAGRIELTFTQPETAHNVKLCSDFQLMGSNSRTPLGCNDTHNPPVKVLSKLRESGDCQRVKVWTKASEPGNFSIQRQPGHYQVCQETGSKIWIDIENFNGAVVDWNDALLEVEDKSGDNKLFWEFDAQSNSLDICVL